MDRRRRVRWWIAVPILLAAAGALLWNGFVRDAAARQERVLAAGLILGAGLLALFLWALLLSGFRWRVRGWILLGCAAGLGLPALLFEVRGVTGDLVPVLGWRLAREGPGPGETPPSTAEAGPEHPAPFWRDYPRFLGPACEAVVEDVTLAQSWESEEPRELWRRRVGPAWSGFAVAGGFAVTQEQRGEREAVVAYGTLDGRMRWVHEAAARFENDLAGIGPRATPTIAGGRVFALGATGLLCCLELETGAPVWSVDVVASNGGEVPTWGCSSSPLVHEGRVIVAPGSVAGRCLVAYDAASGARLWLGGHDRAAYASPELRVLGGVAQVLTLNAGSVSALDPADGRLLWEAPWDHPNPNVSQPLVLPGERVLVSSGYGAGCALLRVERGADGAWAATTEWRTLALKSKLSTLTQREGCVFGFDDGILACVDATTGRRRWKGGRYGHGQLLLVGDVLLVTSEEGELVLVAASIEEHRELARFPALSGKTWNTAALAAPLLLVRNDREAACYRLSLLEPSR